VETTDSDISGYIPTNLISITDGQIYLDTARFERNQRPAVDIGRSVSRIGAMAQPPAIRAAARNLRVLISRFEALEALTRVGLDIDPMTQRTLQRGRILRELLRQPHLTSRSIAEQVITLTAVTAGWLDTLEPAYARTVVERALRRARSECAAIVEVLDAGMLPPGEWQAAIHACLTQAMETHTP
jgi:F-type H+-transporting ATPase subunit alpha